MKNTSEGIATVAIGLDWRPGDKVVAFQEEFPANYFPWKRLEAQGRASRVALVATPWRGSTQACRGARLLAISFVQYLSGHRADLEAIGEICHRHGCLFLVDAIQGLGAFPVDVRKARIHALAARRPQVAAGPGGLRHPIHSEGLAGLHRAGRVRLDQRRRLQRLRQPRHDPAPRRRPLRVRHAEHHRLLRPAGGDRVSAGGRRRADRRQPYRRSATRWRRVLRAKGYQMLGQRTPSSGAGIVSFRKDGVDSRMVVSRLKEKGIVAAPRQGWVRVSPHFYISPDDIEKLIEALP